MMKLSTAISTIILLPNAVSFSPISSHCPSNSNGCLQYLNLVQATIIPSSSLSSSPSQYEQLFKNNRKDIVQLNLSPESDTDTDSDSQKSPKRKLLNDFTDHDQNRAYINGLLQNLSAALDRWIVNGSSTTVRWE